jgi:hypothetical protein
MASPSARVAYSFPQGSGGQVVRVFVGCTFLPFFSFLVAFFDAIVFSLFRIAPLSGRVTMLICNNLPNVHGS